jgi:hypothetical protein
MEAKSRVVASHLVLIQDPEEIQAAKSNQLYHDGKKVLIIRGIPAAQTLEVIYQEFSKRRDLTGNPFRLSHKAKGLVARDQWGEITKVRLHDFRRFIEHWFCLAELTEYDHKPTLVIAKSLPIMLVPLFSQGRYLTPELLGLFDWID